MSRRYGEELRAGIVRVSRAIEELAMAAGHGRMSLKARINDYIPYAQKLPARWDELSGAAQGSWLAAEDVLLMQMLEDLLDVDAEESVQRLKEAVATLGGVSDRELMERARFLVRSPDFVPCSPGRSVVTAFVMLADIEAGSVQTASGGGESGPWVRVSLP
jgi:hypothetical protein